MGAKLGSAKRAREIARLFEAWRRAFNGGDRHAMKIAKREIDRALTAPPNAAKCRQKNDMPN
jgi:hypothetical protein